jgi:hypothetical protein
MATHIGEQLNPFMRAYEYTSSAFLRKCKIVAHFGHSKLVTHIAWARLKDGLQFALK